MNLSLCDIYDYKSMKKLIKYNTLLIMFISIVNVKRTQKKINVKVLSNLFYIK